jgi:pyruvate/2-oxoglutarate dehydrogenase complex dihydrolipoamide dehydrogenase (E3) component
MSKLAQKFVDIVVIGQGDTARLVKKILSYQTKKTHKHFVAKKPRFVSQNTMVIDGEKISAKKFLIILPQLHKTKAFMVVGEHPLPAHNDLESFDTTVKSACVIGSDSYALSQCIALRARGAAVALISEKQILIHYDSSVQDVIGRYLKKIGVVVHMNYPVLSIEPHKNNVHVLADNNGAPLRVSADKLIIAPDTEYLSDIGLGNVEDDNSSADRCAGSR